MPAKLLLLLALGLPLMAQHNVVLTWNDNIQTSCTPTTTPPCNPPGVTYNVYRAPGPCPAANVAPANNPIPFSTLVNVPASTATGLVLLSYTDMGVIAPGQSYCYYVTTVNGYTVNPATGLVVINESAPSNYAQAALVATGATPVAPMNTKAMLQ